MTDYTKILQELAEIRERIGRLEHEVLELQQADASAVSSPPVPPTSPPENSPPEPQAVEETGSIPPLVLNLDEKELIVGGTLTDGFPDCCAVGSEFMGYFCTGTLIASNVVLTAKHCAGQFNVTRVFLKGNDINKPEKGLTINVKEVRKHPDENVDLMLLILEQPTTIDARPIARGSKFKGNSALVVGFGRIDEDGTKGYGKKRKAKVPIMSLDCNLNDEQVQYGCRPGIEMVAGHRGLKKDTCQGDSGGPLYVEDEEGNYLLLGVTSRGISVPAQEGGTIPSRCGNGGIYVRADQFIPWIQSETGVKF